MIKEGERVDLLTLCVGAIFYDFGFSIFEHKVVLTKTIRRQALFSRKISSFFMLLRVACVAHTSRILKKKKEKKEL